MKKSKFTEEQMAFALKQAETGTPVKEVVRKMGITETCPFPESVQPGIIDLLRSDTRSINYGW